MIAKEPRYFSYRFKIVALIGLVMFLFLRAYQGYETATELALLESTVKTQILAEEDRYKATQEIMRNLALAANGVISATPLQVVENTDDVQTLKTRIVRLETRLARLERQIKEAQKQKGKGWWPF